MKLPQIAQIFRSVFIMLALWIGLAFLQHLAFLRQNQQPTWGAIYFFVSLVRNLLMPAIVICTIAGLIALALNQTRTAGEKPPIHAGPIVVLIFATLLALIGLLGVWDAYQGRGGSGEWSKLGDFLMLVTMIPGGLAALASAIFFRTFKRPARIACIGLSLAAIGLALLMPAVENYKRKQHAEQMTQDLEKTWQAPKEPAGGK